MNDEANDEKRRKRNECDPVGIKWDGFDCWWCRRRGRLMLVVV